MSFLKKITAFLIAFSIIVSIPPAFADDSGDAQNADQVINSEELDALIENKLSELNVNPNEVSVALKYTGTGEYYYYNADRWMYSASLYKMPVCMTYSHKIKTGELQADSLSASDDYIYEKILRYSDFGWVTRRIYVWIQLRGAVKGTGSYIFRF